MQKIDVAPTPEIYNSMNRSGYTWTQAVLDIIDNSVDAIRSRHDESGFKKGRVVVKACAKAGASRRGERKFLEKIVIADNGCGMSPDLLKTIFSLGKSSKRGTSALGTFGMGLKTAGFALGGRITVISREAADATLYMAACDQEVQMQTNDWSAIFDQCNPHLEAIFTEHVGDSAGTVVVIEKLTDIVPKMPPSFYKTLKKYVRRVYRYILSPSANLGAHLPMEFLVGSVVISEGFDALMTTSSGGKSEFLLGGANMQFEERKFQGKKYFVRLSHTTNRMGPRPTDDALPDLGSGFKGVLRQGTYLIRGGRQVDQITGVWKPITGVSNLFLELSFEDSGIIGDTSLVQVDFGKKKAHLSEDFQKHLGKNVLHPLLAKVKEKTKQPKEKQKETLKELQKNVADNMSPHVKRFRKGRTKNINKASEKVLNDIFAPASDRKGKKKSKYNGQSLNLGGSKSSTEILFEERAWPGHIPFDIEVEEGAAICIALNTKHKWMEENIFHNENASEVAKNLQLITAIALAIINEQGPDGEPIKPEVLEKMGHLMSIFEHNFGELNTDEYELSPPEFDDHTASVALAN